MNDGLALKLEDRDGVQALLVDLLQSAAGQFLQFNQRRFALRGDHIESALDILREQFVRLRS